MENQVSDVITKADVYVNGIGFIGVATYQSPELKFKKIECNGAAGSYDVAYGAVEKLEASAKLTVTNPILYKAAASLNNAKITFTSALVNNGKAKGRRDVLIGSIDLKDNEAKAGEVYEKELTMSAHYWLKEIGGKPVIEIDKKKNIVKVSGKDLLEDTRKVVGA
jgi:phage tail tube protein FII